MGGGPVDLSEWKGQIKSACRGLERCAERFDLEFAARKDPGLQSVFQRALSVYEKVRRERTENLETRCIRSLWHQTESRKLMRRVWCGSSNAQMVQIPGKKITSRHRTVRQGRPTCQPTGSPVGRNDTERENRGQPPPTPAGWEGQSLGILWASC